MQHSQANEDSFLSGKQFNKLNQNNVNSNDSVPQQQLIPFSHKDSGQGNDNRYDIDQQKSEMELISSRYIPDLDSDVLQKILYPENYFRQQYENNCQQQSELEIHEISQQNMSTLHLLDQLQGSNFIQGSSHNQQQNFNLQQKFKQQQYDSYPYQHSNLQINQVRDRKFTSNHNRYSNQLNINQILDPQNLYNVYNKISDVKEFNRNVYKKRNAKLAYKQKKNNLPSNTSYSQTYNQQTLFDIDQDKIEVKSIQYGLPKQFKKQNNILKKRTQSNKQEISNQQILMQQPRTEDKEFQCSECNKKFARNYVLKQHQLKMHSTEEKKFKCEREGCSRSFLDNSSLQNHLNSHDGIKPYKCELCQAMFSTQGHKKDHIKSKHEMLRPFQCKYCNLTFARKNTLKVHERIHTKERPYECILCQKRFTESGNLRQHIKSHENLKDFTCIFDDCEKRFSTKSILAAHVKSKCHFNELYNICNQKLEYLNLKNIDDLKKQSKDMSENKQNTSKMLKQNSFFYEIKQEKAAKNNNQRLKTLSLRKQEKNQQILDELYQIYNHQSTSNEFSQNEQSINALISEGMLQEMQDNPDFFQENYDYVNSIGQNQDIFIETQISECQEKVNF